MANIPMGGGIPVIRSTPLPRTPGYATASPKSGENAKIALIAGSSAAPTKLEPLPHTFSKAESSRPNGRPSDFKERLTQALSNGNLFPGGPKPGSPPRGPSVPISSSSGSSSSAPHPLDHQVENTFVKMADTLIKSGFNDIPEKDLEACITSYSKVIDGLRSKFESELPRDMPKGLKKVHMENFANEIAQRGFTVGGKNVTIQDAFKMIKQKLSDTLVDKQQNLEAALRKEKIPEGEITKQLDVSFQSGQRFINSLEPSTHLKFLNQKAEDDLLYRGSGRVDTKPGSSNEPYIPRPVRNISSAPPRIQTPTSSSSPAGPSSSSPSSGSTNTEFLLSQIDSTNTEFLLSQIDVSSLMHPEHSRSILDFQGALVEIQNMGLERMKGGMQLSLPERAKVAESIINEAYRALKNGDTNTAQILTATLNSPDYTFLLRGSTGRSEEAKALGRQCEGKIPKSTMKKLGELNGLFGEIKDTMDPKLVQFCKKNKCPVPLNIVNPHIVKLVAIGGSPEELERKLETFHKYIRGIW